MAEPHNPFYVWSKDIEGGEGDGVNVAFFTHIELLSS